ncbi:unannotated protein [freshwater metagenome]|uniref:Unannotated protein n=1 Tax=freshwater metagenome TaxID=449393 RepID=A0A6J6LP34_9ZZZZ
MRVPSPTRNQVDLRNLPCHNFCMNVETRLATLSELRKASEVLAAAFVDYPWIRWTVQEDDRLHRVTELQRAALELLGYPYGEVWVSKTGDDIVSVLVMMDSATFIPPAVEEQSRRAAAKYEGGRHQASLDADEAIHALRPKFRHVQLATIGTLPEVQGQGFGTQTLTAALRSPAMAELDTYLETSTPLNVAFYQHFGFDVIGSKRVAPDGPEVWSMLRTA